MLCNSRKNAFCSGFFWNTPSLARPTSLPTPVNPGVQAVLHRLPHLLLCQEFGLYISVVLPVLANIQIILVKLRGRFRQIQQIFPLTLAVEIWCRRAPAFWANAIISLCQPKLTASNSFSSAA